MINRQICNFLKNPFHRRERVVNSTRGNLEEVNIQGLQPGTNYGFRVVAYNDHGPGDSSEILTVKTDDELDVPGAVANLEAKATSSFSVLITWGQPTHTSGAITGYKLYYRQVNRGSKLNLKLLPQHCDAKIDLLKHFCWSRVIRRFVQN